MNNNSILEIRKTQFIENPNRDNFLKLSRKILPHKEIFDNKFFSKATSNAIKKNDFMGLYHISRLYIELNRNVEAEYLMIRAYEIDKSNNEMLYQLLDIMCRRKQLGLVMYLLEKFDKEKNELLYIKSMIKYFLLTSKKIELIELVLSCFDKFIADEEFIWLVFVSGIQNDIFYFSYKVSKTKYFIDFISFLTPQHETRLKNHLYIIIIKTLDGIKNDCKSS